MFILVNPSQSDLTLLTWPGAYPRGVHLEYAHVRWSNRYWSRLEMFAKDKHSRQARVLVPGKTFQPSLLFVGKAGAYLNEESFRWSILG